MRWLARGMLIVVAFAGGCGQKHGTAADGSPPALPSTKPSIVAAEAPSTPASAPAPTTQPFTAPGVQLSYDASWRPEQSADYVLLLVPKDAADASGLSLSLDIPKLPPHVPGLIPLGSVVNGYVDDLRHEHPGVEVEKPVAAKVAGTNARRVVAKWQADGKTLSEDAVLTVHADRVFIFRANADSTNEERTAHALDELLQSVRWQ